MLERDARLAAIPYQPESIRAYAVPDAAPLVNALKRLFGTDVQFVGGIQGLQPKLRFKAVYIGGNAPLIIPAPGLIFILIKKQTQSNVIPLSEFRI
jgi:hypothetical protein